VRPGSDNITAPPFPPKLEWANVASLRMDKQLGRPVLLDFWDFCRPNSIRALPYVQAWHERYGEHGLRVISVHCPGFEPSASPSAVRAAVERLGISHAVAIDSDFEVWRDYGNPGWPTRYLWDQRGQLSYYHFGEGAYQETELEIQRLLGVELEPVEPLRPEDVPGAELAPQSADHAGSWSGPYAAGGVWAVLDGSGTVEVNGRELPVTHAGAYPLIEHHRHSTGDLALSVSNGVRCHAVCFTPGVSA
jgi:thiol-disulfide isomerase/thioredoxin